ncbi:MAG: MBL fold metallo-hydrolase [Candidatus Omnitrophica bacterium]|jgi:glyoxylase-like metal-dependent hydrolase (beta-lactamase superfamily II)|nr:MBL fold metallo-hydrolase [Candidatus Omnitrophota bacterium]
MICETLVVGPIETNCYVIAAKEGGDAVIIDPGDEPEEIKKILLKHRLKPALVINTHGHYDHIGADSFFEVPVAVHKLDAPMLTDSRKNFAAIFGISFKVTNKIQLLEDGQRIDSAGIVLKVLHTPGHSAGGISLLVEKPVNNIVFTGDALFAGSVGRTDLGGSQEALIGSIKDKLLNLADDTIVYPGHGPATTIGEERRNNPFL